MSNIILYIHSYLDLEIPQIMRNLKRYTMRQPTQSMPVSKKEDFSNVTTAVATMEDIHSNMNHHISHVEEPSLALVCQIRVDP